MSTQERKQSVDFSRKCRDRVNLFFKELKSILAHFPRYQQCREWSRFDILERGIEALELSRGVINGETYCQRNEIDKTNLTNKQLCQLYRIRLNTGFDALRNELDQCKIDLAKFRLFSRAGLLEAACHVLRPTSTSKKRQRSTDDDHYTPVKKIQLNDSGYDSPNVSLSPAIRFQYAYAISRLQAQIYSQQQSTKTEQTYWRPW